MKNSKKIFLSKIYIYEFIALNKQKRLFETQERILKELQKKNKQMVSQIQEKEKKITQITRDFELIRDENKVYELRNHNLNESLKMYRGTGKNWL